MTSLRMRVVEAMAKAWVAYEGDDWEDLNSRAMSAVKACVERELDAALDCLTENSDDVADAMANEVGDYWTHQTRRALDGLVATLKGFS